MDNFVKRTVDVAIDDDIGFESLLLSPDVLLGLKAVGFDRPSPIQLQSIPLAKCGADLVCQAKSGTGKTCVFAVAALESINLSLSKLQVLVLAPTREIAHQIHDVIMKIGQKMKSLKCSLFIGGMPMQHDTDSIKSCHIAIGTPGRIKSLIESNIMLTKSIRLFVLDEADKLLEEGFQEQINWIYSTLPKQKQVLALSATYPQHLADYLSIYMNEPIHVRISTDDLNLKGVRQMFTTVKHHALPNLLYNEKCEALLNCIENVPFHQCMVFSNYQSRSSHLCTLLNKKGWPCTFIAGSQLQPIRLKAISELKSYNCRILVTTDLSARGIDCDKVNLVVNLDMPWDTETYLHRVGRAGRFGTYGLAISIVSGADEIKKLIEVSENINCDIVQLPDDLSQLSDTSRKIVTEKTIKDMSDELLFNKTNLYTDRSNQKENLFAMSIKKDRSITLNAAMSEKSVTQNVLSLKEVNVASEISETNSIKEKNSAFENSCESDELSEATKTLSIHEKIPIKNYKNCLVLAQSKSDSIDKNVLKMIEETDSLILNQADSVNKESGRFTNDPSDASNDNLSVLSSSTIAEKFPSFVTDKSVSTNLVNNIESVSGCETSDKELASNIATCDKNITLSIVSNDKESSPKMVTSDNKLGKMLSIDDKDKKNLFSDKLPKYLSLFSNRPTKNNLDNKENNFPKIDSGENPKNKNLALNTVFTKSIPDQVKKVPQTISKFNPMATCLNLMDFSTFTVNNQMTENRIKMNQLPNDKCNYVLELPNNDCNSNCVDKNDNESDCFEYTACSKGASAHLDVDHKLSSSDFSQSDHSDLDDHHDCDHFSESLSEDESKISEEFLDYTDRGETPDDRSLIRDSPNHLDFSSNISVYEYSSGVQHFNHITALQKSSSTKTWNQLRFVECFGQAYLKHISEIIQYQTKYQKLYKQE
ncbi:probable ATP-dependent RNA helicase DDX20 isoform X3 [Hydra vulgaris]|uniref:RNA helicase n=1 Tax=Hydra vulgaris TaxID=6087 RepID=A0ABM4DIV2_HYDVU